MSLSFDLTVSASRRVAALSVAAHGCALAGLGLAWHALLRSGTPLPTLFFLALSGLTAIALSWWRLRCRASAGRLTVDAAGHPAWSAASDPGASALPLTPVRWFAAAGVIWIEARVDGRLISLLAGVDAVSTTDWIRLMRWLRWLDRGGFRHQDAAGSRVRA